MPRRAGRDPWKPRKVPRPAQRPSFVVAPTPPVVEPPRPDAPIKPPDWMVPGVLVNYYAIAHPLAAKGVPALRNVRVSSYPMHPGGRDWLVRIERKGQPVPTWTLARVSEGFDTLPSRDAETPSPPADAPAEKGRAA